MRPLDWEPTWRVIRALVKGKDFLFFATWLVSIPITGYSLSILQVEVGGQLHFARWPQFPISGRNNSQGEVVSSPKYDSVQRDEKKDSDSAHGLSPVGPPIVQPSYLQIVISIFQKNCGDWSFRCRLQAGTDLVAEAIRKRASSS